MIGIRNPFYRKKKNTVFVSCDHCSRSFVLFMENIRVVNYCGSCK